MPTFAELWASHPTVTGFSYEGRFSDYRKSKAIWFWEVK